MLGRRLELGVAHRAGRLEDGLGGGELVDASASAASSAHVTGRYAHAPSSTSSTTRPSSAIAASWAASGGGPSSSAAALAASSATGRQVEPSRSASVSAWTTAARARAGASGAIPPARAIASAIRNPTPNTLVSSYGRSRTTRCARSPCSCVIRGTSHARPCGASCRCSARLDRSPCHERTASFVRFGFSPMARNARVRVGVDQLEHVGAVPVEQLPRPAGADVLDALEVREQRRVAGRGDRLGRRDADLHAEAAVVLPGAADPRALALLQVGDRPDEDDVVAVALGVEHGEAAVLAGEADPPDDHFALERRTRRALDHRPPEATAMGGLASGAVGSPLDLITAALPGDPALDIAATHALLARSPRGSGRRAARVLPGPTAAFGRLDVLKPGFARGGRRGARARARAGGPPGRRPRRRLRPGRRRRRARHGGGRRHRRAAGAVRGPVARGCATRSPGSAPTPASASCRASTARAATASTWAAGSRSPGSRSVRSAAAR